MKRLRFNHVIIIILIVVSIAMFFLQQLFFHDLHESGFLFFQDLIFLPIHIILVTFLLDRIIYAREKHERLEQMNIVIGAFFSEIGTQALEIMRPAVINLDGISKTLEMNPKWTDQTFADAAQTVKAFDFKVSLDSIDLERLNGDLSRMKPYLLQLFANPGLLEHDTFTDMLWAMFHLVDEFDSRDRYDNLPETDIIHLQGDLDRAYTALVYEWVFYMKHLKVRYPYLWSLGVRKNPFANNSITITEA